MDVPSRDRSLRDLVLFDVAGLVDVHFTPPNSYSPSRLGCSMHPPLQPHQDL